MWRLTKREERRIHETGFHNDLTDCINSEIIVKATFLFLTLHLKISNCASSPATTGNQQFVNNISVIVRANVYSINIHLLLK